MSDQPDPVTVPGGRWLQSLHLIWQPPRAHGEVRPDRVVSPLELFYDLVIVVLVGEAAIALTADLTWAGVWHFTAVFGLIWIAWLNGTIHHDLHSRDDARSRVIVLVQMLILTPMAAFVSHAADTTGREFALTTATLFGLFTLLWVLVARNDHVRYRRANRLFVAATAACAVATAASAFLGPDARMLVWTATLTAYLIGCVLITVTTGEQRSVGLHVTEALAERFALFTIIVLGETVVGVVQGMAHETTAPRTLLVGTGAVVVGFGAWWTYFDFAGHRLPRTGPTTPMVWMLAHLPVGACVTVMGSSMVSLVEDAGASATQPATAWGLALSAAGVLISTVVLGLCLEAWRNNPGEYRVFAVSCLITAAAATALGALRPAPVLLVAGLIAAFALPWTIAVLRRLNGQNSAGSLSGSPQPKVSR